MKAKMRSTRPLMAALCLGALLSSAACSPGRSALELKWNTMTTSEQSALCTGLSVYRSVASTIGSEELEQKGWELMANEASKRAGGIPVTAEDVKSLYEAKCQN